MQTFVSMGRGNLKYQVFFQQYPIKRVGDLTYIQSITKQIKFWRIKIQKILEKFSLEVKKSKKMLIKIKKKDDNDSILLFKFFT